MHRFCVLPLLAAACLAQVPAEVDAALRARVSQFFQYQAEGKFHRAEEFVAEDAKDLFVASSKPSYTSFAIKTIQYSEDYHKAKVFLDVTRVVAAPGFTGQPMPSVIPTRWKVENGQWCWYTIPSDTPSSPFGNLPVAPGLTSSLPSTPRALPQSPVAPSMSAARTDLRVDKREIELKTGEASSGTVTIVNPLPRPVTLAVVDPKVPGLTVTLDRERLGIGEKAVLTIAAGSSTQPPPQGVVVTVKAKETNQGIPIRVSFAKRS